VSVRTQSVRLLNRGRRFTARLKATGGTFTSVRARLTYRGKTVARGSLARLSGTRTIRLKRARRLRRGAHRLVVTATAAGGKPYSSSTLVRLRR
jgi:hypothetical protein